MNGDVKRRPDFVVKAVGSYLDRKGEEHEVWTDIGVAFVNNKSESISLRLNALPLTGNVVLMKPRERELVKSEQKVFRPFGK